MPHPYQRRRGPKPDRRRALDLLAASADGCTEAVMLAHGFSIDIMVELINAGLATKPERILVGGYQEERTRVRITEEGRRALGGIATSRLMGGGEKST